MEWWREEGLYLKIMIVLRESAAVETFMMN